MEIKLSKPDLYFDKHIEACAVSSGCVAVIKWFDMKSARFILVDRPHSLKQASYAAHDQVIRKLFARDPAARVRTAIAVYASRDDFESQKMGSLA